MSSGFFAELSVRAVSLGDLVPADHRVRLVWRYVEDLDLSALMAEIKAVEGRPGRPPAEPRIFMAPWLFATIEGIGSARALARRCAESLPFQWLCGGGGINHKALSDFRVGQGAVLEGPLVDSFAALQVSGVAGLERLAQDGVRLRASADAQARNRGLTRFWVRGIDKAREVALVARAGPQHGLRLAPVARLTGRRGGPLQASPTPPAASPGELPLQPAAARQQRHSEDHRQSKTVVAIVPPLQAPRKSIHCQALGSPNQASRKLSRRGSGSVR